MKIRNNVSGIFKKIFQMNPLPDKTKKHQETPFLLVLLLWHVEEPPTRQTSPYSWGMFEGLRERERERGRRRRRDSETYVESTRLHLSSSKCNHFLIRDPSLLIRVDNIMWEGQDPQFSRMWEDRDPHNLSMSFGTWIDQFLGITSGWTGVTITKVFSTILLDCQTWITLSLGQF